MSPKLFMRAALTSIVLHVGVWLASFNLRYACIHLIPPGSGATQSGWGSIKPGWAELFGWRISDQTFYVLADGILPALVLTAILPTAWGIAFSVAVLRASRRDRSGRCARCGYDLRATPNRCPECGAIPAAQSMLAADRPRPC